MIAKREIPAKTVLDEIAAKNGVAVAVIDRSGIEVSVSNNNSICSSLNPDGELIGACSADCGQALARAIAGDGKAAYTCHAGLECRAVALAEAGKPTAVVVGRCFVKSDNYRRAGERAISGDWSHFPPAQFFESILLSGSAVVVEDAIDAVIKNSIEVAPIAETPVAADFGDVTFDRTVPASTSSDEAPSLTSVWRTFINSLLSLDHASARNAMIELAADQFSLRTIVWLEKRGDRLESTAVSAALKTRKVQIGMPADDERLRDAASGEMPVELGQRPTAAKPAPQRMLLFAMPVGNEIPAALVVLDRINDEDVRRQLARICHAVAPQIELLRLREEVNKRELLDTATKRMSEGLRDIDSAELWAHLTQVSAELLNAERASLITRGETDDDLAVRAAIGSANDLTLEKNPGERVARIVFEKGKPVVVTDVASTGLPPADAERNYKTSSFLSAPVSIDGKQVAVINFTDKATGAAFDRRDLEMVRAITPQLASAIDRTQLKEKAGEFEQLSVTDALTGLLNRRYIEQRLAEEVKRSNRHGYPMSFIMLDVDHFKSFNDSYGHPAGDEALRTVARVIRETLRGADVAARFGGEEFAILLPQTTDDEASAIAERVRHNIASTDFAHRDVTVSMGVASCSSELCSTIDMIAAADKALYQAKANGRNRVCIFQVIVERQLA